MDCIIRSVPSIPLAKIVKFLSGAHVPAGEHIVVIDGEQSGTCTQASFRTILGWRGLEFPLDYAFSLDGTTTKLSARLRMQGLGSGGREQIKVNGVDVTGDDVLVGFEAEDPLRPTAYVEFRFNAGEGDRSIKFLAPLEDADI